MCCLTGGKDTIIDLTDATGDLQSDDGLFASDPSDSEDGADRDDVMVTRGSTAAKQGDANAAMEWEDVDMQTDGGSSGSLLDRTKHVKEHGRR